MPRMHLRFTLLLLFLIPAYFSTQLTLSAPRLEVKAASCQVRLTGDHLQLILGFIGPGSTGASGRFEAELVDPSQTVVSRTQGEFALVSGADRLRLDFPIESRMLTRGPEFQRLPWYQIRYRIEATPQTGTQKAMRGAIFLHEVTSDLFELQLTGAGKAEAGRPYRVVVRVSEPFSGRAREGIHVRGSLGSEDADLEWAEAASAYTGPNGYALLAFEIPRSMSRSQGNVQVAARKGAFSQTVKATFEVENDTHAIAQTDKRIYEPGQTLRSKARFLDSDRRPIAGLPVSFTVRDEDYQLLIRKSGNTSENGLALFDWRIAADSPLEDYYIGTDSEDPNIHGYSRTIVQISRDVRSEFSVDVKTDRDYYLPGQIPQVKVRGSYLFRKANPPGRVRIARKKTRLWHPETKEWIVIEKAEVEGAAGKGGVFSTQLEVDSLRDSVEIPTHASSRYFGKLRYNASFTDSSTGLTRSRRFEVRLTNEEIHIHPLGFVQRPGFPLRFYLRTVYPDGEPAQCDVAFGPAQSEQRTQVRTNRFGLAKVSLSSTSGGLPGEFVFEATDGKGRSGRHSRRLGRDLEPSIRLETKRSLFRAGQPLEVAIQYPGNSPILLYVAKDGKALVTERLDLIAGSTDLSIPYQPAFRGEVTLFAVALHSPADRLLYRNRHVLYLPNDAHGADSDRAQASSSSQGPSQFGPGHAQREGSPMDALMGAGTAAEAIEESAAARRSRQYFASPWRIAGYRLDGFLRLEDSERTDPDVDLVAEVFLRQRVAYRPFLLERSRQFMLEPEEAFSEYYSRQFSAAGVEPALSAFASSTGGFPTDAEQLADALEDAGIVLKALKDPWGIPYRPSFRSETRKFDLIPNQPVTGSEDAAPARVLQLSRTVVHIDFRSSGSDGRPETLDDFDAVRYSGRVSNNGSRPGAPPIRNAALSGTSAQGGLTGTVTDSQGGIIPAASVRVVSASGSIRYSALANGDGVFALHGLPPGDYHLTFDAPGFFIQRTKSVPVLSSLKTVVDAALDSRPQPEFIVL